MAAHDGRWLMTVGLVLVRQMPGSAKGVMFLTVEDETGPANVVVWPTLFDRRRRIMLGSSMIAINDRIQREGEVVHLIATNSSISHMTCPDLPITTRRSSCRPVVATNSPMVRLG